MMDILLDLPVLGGVLPVPQMEASLAEMPSVTGTEIKDQPPRPK